MWASLLACREPEPPPGRSDEGDTHSAALHSSDPRHTAAEPLPCPTFGPGQGVGVLSVPEPTELSGLVAWDGVLWAIDDGDDTLYALDRAGSLTGAAHAVGEVDGYDREDLGRWRDQLLLADTGDNALLRESVALYRFERPLAVGFVDDWPLAGRTDVTWPQGPTDCETVLVDPVTDEVLLVEKARDGVTSVIRVPPSLPASAVGEEVAVLLFGGEGGLGTVTVTTGGSVAPDGTAAVIRTYLDAFVWPRVPGEPWATTFARDACPVDLVTERQGEAIAWADDGLYTVSEGAQPTIWFYPRLD